MNDREAREEEYFDNKDKPGRFEYLWFIRAKSRVMHHSCLINEDVARRLRRVLLQLAERVDEGC
jgi:hypothetical protein